MSSAFKQALQRFQSAVASASGKRAADLKILPASEDVVGFDDQNTGELIAFEATSGALRVRGFASASAVVLARSDLGPLLAAAHVLDAKASLSAHDLAARIVWMMGPNFRLVAREVDYPRRPLPAQVAPPAIERSAGGAVLRFYYLQDEVNASGAPATPFSAEVKCASSYNATLVTNPGP